MDTTNPLNGSQLSSVHEITKAGDYLLMLINQLLDLAKIETGYIELTIKPVVLAKVVQDAIQLVKPLAQRHGITINLWRNNSVISFDELLDAEIVVLADYTRLKQVLINLLSNAIKYNSVNGEVMLTCDDAKNGFVRISVKDSGQGLNQEQQEQLFKAFNRLGAEKSKIEGTGIGLVISRNIIEQMNGYIGVDSTPGKGSTFWVEVPRGMNSEESIIPEVIATHPQMIPGVRERQKLKNTVLYIEDNPANMKLVSELLGRLPYINMLAAAEPQLGIELARKHRPDLILLDINLPGMDGYEVLKILRSDENTCDIPLIAVSANAMTTDITKGIEAGFNEYITKPIDVTHMLLTVDKVLSVH
jgi:CheY-like chemotaxis protein